ARFVLSSSQYSPKISESSGSCRTGAEQANEYGESRSSLTGLLQVLPWSVERARSTATRCSWSVNQFSKSVPSFRQATEGSRSSCSVSMTTNGLPQVCPLSEDWTAIRRPPLGHGSLGVETCA